MKSVLRDWSSIAKRFSKSKPCWLFFDFDGTLAPIADFPARAKLQPQTRQLLQQLSSIHDWRIGAVSGRQLVDLVRKIKLKRITYIGNHGIEILNRKRLFIEPNAKRKEPAMQNLATDLSTALQPIKGALLENKRYTLSIHYRHVKEPQHKAVFDLIMKGLARSSLKTSAVLRQGKKVVEIRPDSGWNKGKGVEWILQRFPVGNRVFFIGDDNTDEDVFRIMKNRAITVRVGRLRGSAAAYYLPKQNQINGLLKKLFLLP